MTQDEKWSLKFREAVGFIQTNHRNLSKNRVEGKHSN